VSQEEQPETTAPIGVNAILERAKEEWEAAFDSISEGLAIIEMDGTIKRVNRTLASLLSRDVRHMVGLKCCDVFPHHRVSADACPVMNYPQGNAGSFEVFFPDYRYYEDSIHPILRSGRTKGLVVTVRDNTREKMAERERHHVTLRMDEAERRRSQSEDLLLKIQQELRQVEKAACVGNLSTTIYSELSRNLTTVLHGLQKLAEIDTTQVLKQHVVSLLGTTERCSIVLDAISRLQNADEISVTELDLPAMMRELVKASQEEAASHNIKLSLSHTRLSPVSGHLTLINTVFESLLRNALDAAVRQGGGEISIDIRREKDLARVDISDTGPGIGKTDLDQVFAPFYSTAGDPSRVGLGLTLCQQIIQSHQGQIVLTSDNAKGTLVTVFLPLVQSSEDN
jgi:signal transduction histidine kinase